MGLCGSIPAEGKDDLSDITISVNSEEGFRGPDGGRMTHQGHIPKLDLKGDSGDSSNKKSASSRFLRKRVDNNTSSQAVDASSPSHTKGPPMLGQLGRTPKSKDIQYDSSGDEEEATGASSSSHTKGPPMLAQLGRTTKSKDIQYDSSSDSSRDSDVSV